MAGCRGWAGWVGGGCFRGRIAGNCGAAGWVAHCPDDGEGVACLPPGSGLWGAAGAPAGREQCGIHAAGRGAVEAAADGLERGDGGGDHAEPQQGAAAGGTAEDETLGQVLQGQPNRVT